LKDGEGRAALSWAAGNGCDGVVEMLIEVGGADVDAADSSGQTWMATSQINIQCGIVPRYLHPNTVW
jgi:ankyrin repeat protein